MVDTNEKETQVFIDRFTNQKNSSMNYQTFLETLVPFSTQDPSRTKNEPSCSQEWLTAKIYEKEITLRKLLENMRKLLVVSKDFMLRTLFLAVDTERLGSISPEALHRYVSDSPLQLTQEDLLGVFRRFNSNLDGALSFEDFKVIFVPQDPYYRNLVKDINTRLITPSSSSNSVAGTPKKMSGDMNDSCFLGREESKENEKPRNGRPSLNSLNKTQEKAEGGSWSAVKSQKESIPLRTSAKKPSEQRNAVPKEVGKERGKEETIERVGNQGLKGQNKHKKSKTADGSLPSDMIVVDEFEVATFQQDPVIEQKDQREKSKEKRLNSRMMEESNEKIASRRENDSKSVNARVYGSNGKGDLNEKQKDSEKEEELENSKEKARRARHRREKTEGTLRYLEREGSSPEEERERGSSVVKLSSKMTKFQEKERRSPGERSFGRNEENIDQDLFTSGEEQPRKAAPSPFRSETIEDYQIKAQENNNTPEGTRAQRKLYESKCSRRNQVDEPKNGRDLGENEFQRETVEMNQPQRRNQRRIEASNGKGTTNTAWNSKEDSPKRRVSDPNIPKKVSVYSEKGEPNSSVNSIERSLFVYLEETVKNENEINQMKIKLSEKKDFSPGRLFQSFDSGKLGQWSFPDFRKFLASIQVFDSDSRIILILKRLSVQPPYNLK